MNPKLVELQYHTLQARMSLGKNRSVVGNGLQESTLPMSDGEI